MSRPAILNATFEWRPAVAGKHSNGIKSFSLLCIIANDGNIFPDNWKPDDPSRVRNSDAAAIEFL